MIDDAIRKKRHRDLADDAEAGFDTTAEEDSRLRQESPEQDDASREAEQMIKIFREVVPHWWRLHDPEELAKLKEELRQSALEERGQKPAPPQARRKSQLERDNEFWNSDEPKNVMPKRL